MLDREEIREVYYTPGRVGWWVEHWRLLQELALPTCPAITYDRVSAAPIGMRLTDRTRYADILADLQLARLHLKWYSGPLMVADAMTTEPLDWNPTHDYLEIVADGLGVSLYDAQHAWDEAREIMAGYLGWKSG